MLRCSKLQVATLSAALMLPCVATSATLSASGATQIQVGATASVTLNVTLDAGEDASVFEGVFDLTGLGSIADLTIDGSGYGSSWDAGTFGNVLGAQQELRLSLTSSSNRADHSLLATLDITGLSQGAFEIVVSSGTFLQRDTNTSPFFEDVPLGPPTGTVIGLIEIVPEPSTALLVAFGCSALAGARRLVR